MKIQFENNICWLLIELIKYFFQLAYTITEQDKIVNKSEVIQLGHIYQNSIILSADFWNHDREPHWTVFNIFNSVLSE